MTPEFDIRSTDMPQEMHRLLSTYPRDTWEAHPGFAEKTRHWLRAHQMFRDLADVTRSETELYLDKTIAPERFAQRLSRYGNALVQNLHGHHNWEDRNFFPELSAADTRFDRGLDILESDHTELDTVLDHFTHSANRVLKLMQLDPEQSLDEAGQLRDLSETIERFLERHLGDEEDLAVPIILHHRLRG